MEDTNFNLRIPVKTHRYLKIEAAKTNKTITGIILECIDKYKKELTHKG
jgi:predicted HicB family RNase H-like nuclease